MCHSFNSAYYHPPPHRAHKQDSYRTPRLTSRDPEQTQQDVQKIRSHHSSSSLLLYIIEQRWKTSNRLTFWLGGGWKHVLSSPFKCKSIIREVLIEKLIVGQLSRNFFRHSWYPSYPKQTQSTHLQPIFSRSVLLYLITWDIYLSFLALSCNSMINTLFISCSVYRNKPIISDLTEFHI